MRLSEDTFFCDDPIAVYLSEARTVPIMGADEESDCIDHIRAGDSVAESARKRLIEANLLVVVAIAERYQSDNIHLLDLIAHGNEGLLQATKNLNESRDNFSAHATPHIERAIAKAISGLGPAAG